MDSPPQNFDSADNTSASLLKRLQDLDDNSAWRRFFDRYWQLIYNFSRRSGLGDADSQDIVQEVMVNLTTALPKFRQDRQRARFKTWLLTIVKRRIIDAQRKRMRRPQTTESAEEHFPGQASELEKVWDDEWAAHVVNVSMAQVRGCVPARQFLIYDLLTRQGASVADVCRVLDTSAAAVYLAKHRVAKLMRQEVNAIEQGSD